MSYPFAMPKRKQPTIVPEAPIEPFASNVEYLSALEKAWHETKGHGVIILWPRKIHAFGHWPLAWWASISWNWRTGAGHSRTCWDAVIKLSVVVLGWQHPVLKTLADVSECPKRRYSHLIGAGCPSSNMMEYFGTLVLEQSLTSAYVLTTGCPNPKLTALRLTDSGCSKNQQMAILESRS